MFRAFTWYLIYVCTTSTCKVITKFTLPFLFSHNSQKPSFFQLTFGETRAALWGWPQKQPSIFQESKPQCFALIFWNPFSNSLKIDWVMTKLSLWVGSKIDLFAFPPKFWTFEKWGLNDPWKMTTQSILNRFSWFFQNLKAFVELFKTKRVSFR
jgi:hypothetical protein